ncbi:hypothetical protein [Streptomyces sp. NPDC048644]|uniref:hypothetical protein n=1 Tax=Streptomyces sp. NPDC048644 TaxID=3365582 RepID=UPI00370FCACD
MSATLDKIIDTIEREEEEGAGARRSIRIGQQLHAVAQHLTIRRPADPMTDAARMTISLRVARTAPAARPLLRRLPFPAGGITRGEYALRLHRAAWGTGYSVCPHCEVNCPTCNESNEAGSACKRCGN